MGFTNAKIPTKNYGSYSKNNILDKVNNPIGNMPMADNPFFFDPKQSDMPIPSSQLSTVKKSPINSLAIKSGGAIDSNLFKIDFSKNKKNRKKVMLNLE